MLTDGGTIFPGHRRLLRRSGQPPSIAKNVFKESKMTDATNFRIPSYAGDDLARGVKGRIRWLFLAGMVAVALVFGLTFYFALISNQSALARQVPELEAVAEKLKSVLVVNTLIFVAIIVASFVALGTVITSRLFEPLALLHRDLAGMAEAKFLRVSEERERGPFSVLDEALRAAVSALRDRERKEIEELLRLADTLSRNPQSQETARTLRDLAAGKAAFIGSVETRREAREKEAGKDPLFIQPL
jgi:hypothetical protein